MTDKEAITKHLEIIQGVINRLANNSFLIKSWSITILSAVIVFITNSKYQTEYIILSFGIPVIIFWGLDAYFLWQERLFRGIYDDVRLQKTTHFEMNISAQKEKKNNKYWNAFFSTTLIPFYIAEMIFIGIVFYILRLCL